MQKQSGFVWGTIILSVVALLFQFLAVCLPHWTWYDIPTTNRGMISGLFSSCAMIDDDDTICQMHTFIPSWLEVVRTFEMFGLVLLFIASVLLTLYLLLLQWKAVLHGIFIVTFFVIVFFLLIGISVYGHNADGQQLHVGFAFAVISTILSIVPPILLIIMFTFRREKNVWLDQDTEAEDQAYIATEMQSRASRRSSKVEPMTTTQEQRAASRMSQSAEDKDKEPLH